MSERPLSQIVREIMVGIAELLRSEIHLAKAEFAWSAKRITGQGPSVAIGAVLAWFGAHALVAFLVLGLGALLGSYWVSALIVGIVMVAAGGLMLKSAIHKISHMPLKPSAIQGIQNDKEMVVDSLRRVS